MTARIAPEFVITGLHPATAQQLLNNMAGRVFQGASSVAHGTLVCDLINGFDAVVIDGADQVRLQQIVWPDPDGRFSWASGYHLSTSSQPLIGRP